MRVKQVCPQHRSPLAEDLYEVRSISNPWRDPMFDMFSLSYFLLLTYALVVLGKQYL